jgi:hypothetical protein
LPETDDRTALARVIRSEAGTQTIPERVAVAWTCRNNARDRKVSVAKLVCAPCGKQAGYRRPFSTALPPRAQDLELADAVLAMPQEQDVTDGAIHCFEPALADKLHALGRGDNAATIRQRWTTSYGLERYGKIGHWELYGRPRRPRTPTPVAPASTVTA